MSEFLLDAVAEVATLAGNFALSRYGAQIPIHLKSDGSPVTAADRGAEQIARDWIEKWYPNDGVLGEEFDDVHPDAMRRWILDPIDGTKSFVRQVPLWGTLVAVAEGDSVLAGCAYFPALAETIVAAVGEGCFWNGARCNVSTQSAINQCTVLATDDMFPGRPDRARSWHQLASQAGMARTWGDCYGYLLVATGRAEVMIDSIAAPWDAAALYPIITEAGGSFTDWSNSPTAFGGDIIATNAALAQSVRDILIPTP